MTRVKRARYKKYGRNKDEETSGLNLLGMTVIKYPIITEEMNLKNKTYKSYCDSIAEEKKICSDSEDISETNSDNMSDYEFMNENYEYNERYSIKTEEDEKAVTRAPQISLLEEENKVAKMKDLRDNLSKELELTTQEYLQKSKKARREIWKFKSKILSS